MSNTRVQHNATVQSIRDLRTSLRDRSAAYLDELTCIALSPMSSVERVRLQRDNVDFHHHADKAKMEKEIDELQEKITAFLE